MTAKNPTDEVLQHVCCMVGAAARNGAPAEKLALYLDTVRAVFAKSPQGNERLEVASRIMAGFAGAPVNSSAPAAHGPDLAVYAIAWADALIAQSGRDQHSVLRSLLQTEISLAGKKIDDVKQRLKRKQADHPTAALEELLEAHQGALRVLHGLLDAFKYGEGEQ